MGMISNKIEVMLLTKKREKVYWELWLDNEISTELTEDKSLFSASSVEEFAESIGKGFKDEYPDEDDEPDPNFIKQYSNDFAGCNPFDEEDDYTRLKNLITEYAQGAPCPEAFKKVVLVANNQCSGRREYHYIVFNLKTRKCSAGCKYATFGANYYYDPDDCTPKSKEFMETLL